MKNIGINTDPLDIILYIDLEGKIKWKFNDSIHITTNKDNVPLEEDDEEEDIVNTLFKNIYLINSTRTHDFKNISYNSKNIELLDLNFTNNITYETFDYILYSKQNNITDSSREELFRQFDPKKYMVNNSTEQMIISAIIKSLNEAIGKNLQDILLIFGNRNIAYGNIKDYKAKSKEFEHSEAKMILFCNSEKPNTIKDINSIYIKNDFFEVVLNEYHTSKTPYLLTLVNILNKNYFSCIISEVDIFY